MIDKRDEIVIVDYGLGNSRSIKNMLKKAGYSSVISRDVSVLDSAKLLMLPGVGAFDTGMQHLEDLGLKKVLDRKVLEEKIPILGICLGMQLLTKESEEGNLKGLGYINAETVKFDPGLAPNIPHMGWNYVDVRNKPEWFGHAEEKDRFYFVHSYYVKCKEDQHVLTNSTYGEKFVSSFADKNVVGFQFHPEKSHKFGLHLLTHYLKSNYAS